MRNRARQYPLWILAALLLIQSIAGGFFFSIGRSKRSDGPNYYTSALELASDGQYQKAIEYLEVCQGRRPVRGEKVPNIIPEDVGRKYKNASDYLVDCMPNRELGIIHYRMGCIEKREGDLDAADTLFGKAKQFLTESIDQLPTLRAADFLGYTIRELELTDTGAGPEFGTISFSTRDKAKRPFTDEILVSERVMVLSGECRSPSRIEYVRVNEIPVDSIRGIDDAGNSLDGLEVNVDMVSGRDEPAGQRREQHSFVHYQPRRRARFQHTLRLRSGKNEIRVSASDVFGNTTEKALQCVRDSSPPAVSLYSEKDGLRVVLTDRTGMPEITATLAGQTIDRSKSLTLPDAKAAELFMKPNELRAADFLLVVSEDTLGNRLKQPFYLPDYLEIPPLEGNSSKVEKIEVDVTEETKPAMVFIKDPAATVDIVTAPRNETLAPRTIGGETSHATSRQYPSRDTFIYHVADGTPDSVPVAATVAVTPVNAPPVFHDLDHLTRAATPVYKKPEVIPFTVSDPESSPVSLSISTEKGLVDARLLGQDYITLCNREGKLGPNTVTLTADDGQGGVTEMQFRVIASVEKKAVIKPEIALAGYSAESLAEGISVQADTFAFAADCFHPRGISQITVSLDGHEDIVHNYPPRNGQWPKNCTVTEEFNLEISEKNRLGLLEQKTPGAVRFHCKIQVNRADPLGFDIYRTSLDRSLRQELRIWAAPARKPQKNAPAFQPDYNVKTAAISLFKSGIRKAKQKNDELEALADSLSREFFLLCGNSPPTRLNCVTRLQIERTREQQKLARAGIYNKLFEVRTGNRRPIEWFLDCEVREAPGLGNYLLHFSVRDCNTNQMRVLSFDLPFYTDATKTFEEFLDQRLRLGVDLLKQKLVMPVIPLDNPKIASSGVTLPVSDAAGLLPNMRCFFFGSEQVYGNAEPLTQPDGPYYQGIVRNIDDRNIYLDVIPEISDMESFRKQAKYAAVR